MITRNFSIFYHFLDLFFPRFCPACGKHMLRNEKVLCSECLLHLPKTDYHHNPDNPVAQALWGRVKIEQATAWYLFEKGSRYQKLIHEIKYRGKKELGKELGFMFGEDLLETDFQLVDYIVPVPLHKRKERKRGYNQSEWIAQGIAEILCKPLVTDILYRKFHNPSQTHKTRVERWENVSGIFALHDQKPFRNKHILLVDDVFTTGATMEACAEAVLKAGGSKISLAVLGYDV